MSKKGQASLLINLNQGICGMSVFGGMPVMILEGHGMPPSQAQGVLFVGTVVSFLCNLGAIFLVDRIGRRPLLLTSTAGMGISFASLLLCTQWSNFLGADAILAWIVGLLLTVGRAFFDSGVGPVPYVYAPELLTNEIRSAGLSLGKIVQQLGVVVSVNCGLALAVHSRTMAYAFFLCVDAALLAGTYLLCPETLGTSLEQCVPKQLQEHYT